jgi:hypothetical protein
MATRRPPETALAQLAAAAALAIAKMGCQSPLQSDAPWHTRSDKYWYFKMAINVHGHDLGTHAAKLGPDPLTRQHL